MESLESRCLFNVGPGFAAEYFAAPPQGALESFRGDGQAANFEPFREAGRPSDFGAAQYGFGPQGFEPQGFEIQGYESAEVLFVQPVFVANFVVLNLETPVGATAERSSPPPATHESEPTASLRPLSSADESPSQGAARSFAFISAANTQLVYASDLADDESSSVKSLLSTVINSTQRADQPARSDAIDAGRPVLPWLATRLEPLVSLGADEGRHSTTPLLQLGDPNHAGAEIQGKRPTEAPTNLDYDAALMRPIAQIGGSAAIDDAVDSLLGSIRAPFDGQPQAAVAVRSAASFVSGVQLHLWQASGAAFDAQLPWASLAPLLPHVSSETAQLGEALDAVLADLDELGEGIVSSLTDGDHIAWWLGAGGVIYYVASRHFHGRAANKTAVLQRTRRSVATAPRRLSLSVRPLFD